MGIDFLNTSFIYKIDRKNKVLALEDINLKINKENEFIAIVGKTGSGKSTLIQLMNLLLIPTSGNLTILDNIVRLRKKQKFNVNKIRQKIGLVFQFPEYQLFSETVFKDVEFGVKYIQDLKNDSKNQVIKTLNILKIDQSLWEKSPFKISGGEQRKTAIAGILALNPDILILDEPTRGLDPQSQIEIMEIFKTIHEDYNKTIIFITHDMDLVYKYANRCIVLNDKKIVYDGNNKDLFLSNVYKENNLKLPKIIEIINTLNKFGYNISYKKDILDIYKELENV